MHLMVILAGAIYLSEALNASPDCIDACTPDTGRMECTPDCKDEIEEQEISRTFLYIFVIVVIIFGLMLNVMAVMTNVALLVGTLLDDWADSHEESPSFIRKLVRCVSRCCTAMTLGPLRDRLARRAGKQKVHDDRRLLYVQAKKLTQRTMGEGYTAQIEPWLYASIRA